MKRKPGKSGIEVSAMGMGCWAIGGPWTWSDVRQMSWGQFEHQLHFSQLQQTSLGMKHGLLSA